jgi:hypothetical protein
VDRKITAFRHFSVQKIFCPNFLPLFSYRELLDCAERAKIVAVPSGLKKNGKKKI